MREVLELTHVMCANYADIPLTYRKEKNFP